MSVDCTEYHHDVVQKQTPLYEQRHFPEVKQTVIIMYSTDSTKKSLFHRTNSIPTCHPRLPLQHTSLTLISSPPASFLPIKNLSIFVLRPLQLILLDAKGHLQQILLLLLVHALQPRRHTRARVATGIHDVPPIVVFRIIQQRLDPRLHEAPRARVQRLLLAVHDVLRIRIAVQVVAELGPGEGVQLLDARNGHVLELGLLGAGLDERGVDLSSAEDDAVDALVVVDLACLVGGVRDDPLEVRVARELFNVGARVGVAEEVLGEEEDEGFAELAVHLPTEDVEDVGWLSEVGDLHVAVLVLAVELVWGWEDARIFVAKLQIALHAAGRVLGTLAVVAVGQIADETGSLQPFHFTRGDELVDDALCVVGKVTKLCFPHDEGIRRRERVTVFKSEAISVSEWLLRNTMVRLTLRIR